MRPLRRADPLTEDSRSAETRWQLERLPVLRTGLRATADARPAAGGESSSCDGVDEASHSASLEMTALVQTYAADVSGQPGRAATLRWCRGSAW